MKRISLKIGAALAIFALGCGMAIAENAAAGKPTANFSVSALYNLGNQAARAGHPALAVLNYERARLLAPQDKDILANLQTVQSAAGLATQPRNWLGHHARLVSPNLMYWAGLLGLALAGTSVLSYRLVTTRRRLLVGAALIGTAVTALSITEAIATVPVLNEAVVMLESPASASPVTGADMQFVVPAAVVVHVLDQHQGFVLIRDAQHREGWVARSHVTPVIPAVTKGQG